MRDDLGGISAKSRRNLGEISAKSAQRADPHLPEDITLIRALRDSNLPKFLYDDVPLFMAIIQVIAPLENP